MTHNFQSVVYLVHCLEMRKIKTVFDTHLESGRTKMEVTWGLQHQFGKEDNSNCELCHHLQC